MTIDLLQELWLEGDHANEAVDRYQVGDNHQCEDGVLEKPPQRWNKIW